jgi:hypothetical protein
MHYFGGGFCICPGCVFFGFQPLCFLEVDEIVADRRKNTLFGLITQQVDKWASAWLQKEP